MQIDGPVKKRYLVNAQICKRNSVLGIRKATCTNSVQVCERDYTMSHDFFTVHISWYLAGEVGSLLLLSCYGKTNIR